MNTTEAVPETVPDKAAETPDELKVAMTAAWDHGAADYDGNWAHGLKTTVERDAWMALLERLLPRTPSLRILDVGTGTGFLALLLSELGHDVTGVDLSEGMLAIARAKAEVGGLDATFVVGVAESPPVLDSFDVVVARHVIRTLQRPESAVRAWSDLLHPGGRGIVIDGLWHPSSLSDRLLEIAGRYIGQLRAGTEHREHRYPKATERELPLKHLKKLEPARNVFARAGLADILAEELTWIDDVERSVMPIDERLRNRYRRYLLEGTRPLDERPC